MGKGAPASHKSVASIVALVPMWMRSLYSQRVRSAFQAFQARSAHCEGVYDPRGTREIPRALCYFGVQAGRGIGGGGRTASGTDGGTGASSGTRTQICENESSLIAWLSATA